jgi:hypothetical protein
LNQRPKAYDSRIVLLWTDRLITIKPWKLQ